MNCVQGYKKKRIISNKKYIPKCLPCRIDQINNSLLLIKVHTFRRVVEFDDDISNLNFKVLGFLR